MASYDCLVSMHEYAVQSDLIAAFTLGLRAVVAHFGVAADSVHEIPSGPEFVCFLDRM